MFKNKEIVLVKEQQEFINQYQQYVNRHNKISPYTYVVAKYGEVFQDLIESTVDEKQKFNILRSIIDDSFYSLPLQAKKLNIPSVLFDYVGPKNLSKIERKINTLSVTNAITSLYSSWLSGDNMSVIR